MRKLKECLGRRSRAWGLVGLFLRSEDEEVEQAVRWRCQVQAGVRGIFSGWWGWALRTGWKRYGTKSTSVIPVGWMMVEHQARGREWMCCILIHHDIVNHTHSASHILHRRKHTYYIQQCRYRLSLRAEEVQKLRLCQNCILFKVKESLRVYCLPKQQRFRRKRKC